MLRRQLRSPSMDLTDTFGAESCLMKAKQRHRLVCQIRMARALRCLTSAVRMLFSGFILAPAHLAELVKVKGSVIESSSSAIRIQSFLALAMMLHQKTKSFMRSTAFHSTFCVMKTFQYLLPMMQRKILMQGGRIE